MNISLTPELEHSSGRRVKHGMSASDVANEGLQLLRHREIEDEALRAAVQIGFDEAERGEYTEYDVDTIDQFFDEVKSNGRARLFAETQK